MNKKIFLILIFFITISILNAEEKHDFSLQLVKYGFGLNFSNQQVNSELSLGIFNLYIDDYKTNIGFGLSPFNIRTIFDNEEINPNHFSEWTFLNISAYWNIINSNDFTFGPFFSVNYLSIINWQKFDLQNITINSGFKFMMEGNNYEFIGRNYLTEIEFGYRYNIYNGHKFYFSISVDLIATFVVIGNILKFFY